MHKSTGLIRYFHNCLLCGEERETGARMLAQNNPGLAVLGSNCCRSATFHFSEPHLVLKGNSKGEEQSYTKTGFSSNIRPEEGTLNHLVLLFNPQSSILIHS